MAHSSKTFYTTSEVLNILDTINHNESDLEDDVSSTDDEDELYTLANEYDNEEIAGVADTPDSDENELLETPESVKTKNKTYHWLKTTFEPPDVIFRGEKLQLPDHYELPSPLQFFEEFLTEDMLDLLVEMTNQYSVEKTGKSDVILKLCSSLPQNVPGQPSFNYKIYADNFFTGMALLVELQKLGIHYTGTVRPNRIPGINLQNEAEMKKKGRGIMDQPIKKTTKIVAVRWYDTRAVNVLSTFSGTDPRNPVSQFEKSKSMYVPVQRPAVIKLYNENMGGVDLHDCCVAKNSYCIKSKPWYMYIFWQTIRMMLVNAWLSYRRVTGLLGYSKRDTMNQRKFQARLATLLIQFENSSERKRGRPSAECSKESLVKRRRLQTLLPNPQIATDGYNHFIIKNDNHQRCRLCSLKTNNVCEKCNVFHCFTEKRNCFREFHFSS
ncbi:piggyBac transposable element-derived protein 2-like [Physella acuta]|uniref:piggyBac transposable element-derived protein 2-like n=1 Tax=Physella acuta TaxID=109671 RepID=UPI0027DCA389|nr:piggyBac transposable element-derived protein 2-like [Physella acuta]